MKDIFLKAEWRNLIMVNYCIDADILKPYIPYKTELDLWNNKCYISLVGFMFLNTKVKGLKIPFHTNFEEVNLRFYVKYKEDNIKNLTVRKNFDILTLVLDSLLINNIDCSSDEVNTLILGFITKTFL